MSVGAYILRRLLLMIPTIVGIMAISFAVIQFAPGGPVEQVIAQTSRGRAMPRRAAFQAAAATSRGPNNRSGGERQCATIAARRGSTRLHQASSKKQFGFDKPPLQRFLKMMWDYSRFDFGESYFRRHHASSI